MPAGSVQQWQFAFTTATGAPYNITGATWEYVARTSPVDLTVPPLIDITTGTTTPGVITVNVALAQVTLTISPAATVSIPPGSYSQALWMNPGTTGAFCWVSGQLLIQGTPQP
jgi:hypothetical protein